MKRSLLLAWVIVALAGLARAADPPATAPAPATQAAALLAIRYQRIGGFAGTNDVIEITPEGAVVLQGKLMGTGKGQLTAEQRVALTKLFADWDKMAAHYPAPPGLMDGFEIRIRYGTKEVTASDVSPTLPASLSEICRQLEKIAGDIKGK